MATDITRLLGELRRPESNAAAELLPLVYADLRRLAAAHLSGRPGQTLQPTALVHEVYLKMVGTADPGWEGRGHFFGVAALAMREIIVDHARRKSAAKRGSGRSNLPLDAAAEISVAGGSFDEVLAVDEALKRLETAHPRPARLVLLRYFAGLSEHEIAEALGVTTRTVERDWRFARAWLRGAMSGEIG